VIGRGQLMADCTTEEFIERSSEKSVLVKSPDVARLAELITADGGVIAKTDGDEVTVRNLLAPRIGHLAASAGIELHELAPQAASLEEAFMELTRGSAEYEGSIGGAPAPSSAQPSSTEGPSTEGSAA
jgi:ABC-2 type transport system ATP-binding protein